MSREEGRKRKEDRKREEGRGEEKTQIMVLILEEKLY